MFLTKLWARLSDLRSAEEVRDLRARRAMQAAELALIEAEAHVAIAQKKLEHRTKEWLDDED